MKRVLLVLLATSLLNCAMTAPRGKYRIKADETQTTPYGAWSLVQVANERYEGELLAIDESAVYLELQRGPYCVPIGSVTRVRVAQYYGSVGETTALYFAGAVATPLMHGFLFIFSAPVWIITGAATAGIAPGSETWSTSGIFTSGAIPWNEIKPWARYPVGPPSQLREVCGLPAGQQPNQRPPTNQKPPGFEPIL